MSHLPQRNIVMKRFKVLIFALILFATISLLATLAFAAQNESQMEKYANQADWDSNTSLSEETTKRIRQDYLDYYTKAHTPDATVDDVYIWRYYGTNGDCVAVIMNDRFTGHTLALTSDVVDGVTIHYRDSNKMFIWTDGSFQRLQNAYDMDLISKGNLIDISLIPV